MKRGLSVPAFCVALAALLAVPALAAVPQPEAYCLAVADSGDNLIFINKDGDGFVDQGGTGTSTMEAMAFNPGVSSCGQVGTPRNIPGCLYAIHGDNFGFLDYDDSFDTDGNDSEFIQVSADVGACDLDGNGTPEFAINDVDGLQFDLTRTDASTGNFVLWATERTGGNDVIFQIDPTTGLVDPTPTPGFAGGASCVRLNGAGLLGDLDDIAIDPTDGTIYVVNNAGGTIDLLVEVDPVTGAGTIIGNFFNPLLQVQDMEGLSFGMDGQLYGVTGTSNEFFTVDKDNALAIPIVDFNVFSGLGDYEAVTCLTDNLITGTVFFDVDGDGTLDAVDGDAGFGGARVLIYIDNNNDGTVDGGDTLLCDNPGGGYNLECPVTAPDGFYQFTVGQGSFVAEVDTASLPAGHSLSTDNIEEADFANTDFGQVDPDNDFGFTIPPGAGGLDVTKTSDAGGPVVQGQTITYTIEVTNNTGVTNTNLRLTDSLPPGVAYDPQSTVVTGPVSQLFQALDRFDSISYANDDGRDSWAGPWVETDLDGGGGPTGGEVQVDASGELRLDNNINAANLPFIDRTVDLSAFAGAGAILRYRYRLSSGVDTSDAVVVEASNGGPFGVIDTITGQAGPALQVRTVDLTPFISATTTIRFRITVDYNTTANNEFFYADNVEVLAGDSYRDLLDTAAVNRQDGSLNWSTDWLEIGEANGPSTGDTRIGIAAFGRNVMRIQDNDNGGEGWQREADLSTAEEAILTFLYRRDGLDNAADYVSIEASDDGGASWTELARLDGASGNDAVYVPAALDITAFASTQTRIRFLSSPGLGGGDRVYFDDINILVPRVATVTKDNLPGAPNPELVDGVPPLLVRVGDEFFLPDGDTLTVTLRVVVENPLDPYRPNLLNTVVVTSAQDAGFARHADPVISGAVGDRVWLDTDGDGVQDVGEAGIPNVQVSLRLDDDSTAGPSAGDSVYDTRTTGADGDYLFDYLPPGSYWVDVTDATVPAGLVQSPGNIDPPTDPIASAPLYTVASDEVFLTADFGYTSPGATAVIGDYVWNDIDRDGVQDPTEVGIGDVTLELRSAGPDGAFGTADDVVESTTTTGADGSYLFTAVPPGEYIVVVTDTGGELNGFAPTVGPQSEGASVSAPVTVADGDVVDDIDFGYAPSACLPRIDFETDALGNPLVAGQVIDDEWAEWGITASFTVNAPSTGPLMIFDSANPTGGDVDLGSPNETCVPPGPGVGTEGELGQPGENCFPRGNLLILSEDGDGSDPDDAADGGTIVFSFADALEIDALLFLDSENNQDSVEVLAEPVDSYLDQFGAVSYTNSDGALDWSGDAWDEVTTDDGTAAGGSIRIVGGELLLEGTGGNPERRIERDVDLTGFGAASFSFDWRCVGDMEQAGAAQDTVHIEISANGGGSWITLESKIGEIDMCLEPGDNDGGSERYDLAALLDADPSDSRIRFRYTISAADEDFFVDNLEVSPTLFFSNLAAPGDNAFERLSVGVSGARELRITFPASGALAGIDFCLGSLRDKVWLDANEDGLFQASEMGIPGVTVSLLSDPDGVPDNGDEVVVATTITDANGNFGFDGLEDGDYLIQITDTGGELSDLGGITPPGIARELAVAIVDGDDVVGINFGYNAAGTLGDRIWSDVDGDGVQDPGEPGIGGVLVNLLDGLGNPVLDAANNPITATTAADGSYLFSGLPPGDYIVEVDVANFALGQPLNGYLQTGDPDEAGICVTCDDEGASTLGFGDSDLTLDFGYQADTAAVYPISGTVFEDADEDGFFDDPGENTFAGVTIELRDDMGNVIAVTTTDANGDYLFADQPDGDYTVAVTDEAGILDGYRLTSGLDEIDVTVAGAPVADIDFGYIRDPQTASIGDTVWFDADGDGLPGPTEPGIPNVALDLYQDDGDGVLEPTVEVLDGRIDLDGDGDVDNFDDGFLAGIRIIDGRLDLDGDGFITVADDGTFNGATVIDGGIDFNASGGVDGTDDGTLAGDDGLPIATTLTDGNGQYLFPDLAAGAYFVDVRESTVPDSTADGVPDLVETGYPSVDPSDAITLSEGERYEDADFGYVPRPGTAAIGDRVWHDTNGDGVQDDGELGIPGVDILVTGPGPDQTITTRADGFWMATGLTAASTLYSVNYDSATVPAGLTQTFPGDVSYQVTVNDGDLFTHLDYGFTGGAYGSIGSLVWLDLNGDGDVDAGDPPIEGVTVSLIDDRNGDGVWDPDGADDIFGTADDEPILETGTTDPAGSYLFTGVPLSADYLVDVSDIGGVLAGLQKTKGTDDLDNNSQDDPYDVTMPGVPTSILTGDFGYTPAGGFGSIGNKVWHDLDGDGFRDAGEPGIQGVTVELWLDVDGDGMLTPGVDNLIRNATTDTSGEYEFKSLPLGDYLVNVTDDAGVLTGLVKTAGTPTVDDNSQVNPYPVTLTNLDPDNVTGDFGYQADPINSVLTISGTVFEDTDNDATFDDGAEPEVSGATVFLFRDLDMDGVLDPTDPLIGSVLSDPAGPTQGDFLFTNLPPGDYLLAVNVDGTPVDDFLQTTQSATGGVQPVSLPATDPPDPGAPNSTGNDFGFRSAERVGLTATKSDALAVDADEDGVPSPGDTLEYTVTLINTGNTTATAVAFSDAVPAHTGLVPGSVTTSQGRVDLGDPFQVTVGEMPGGDATVNITFRVLIDATVPAGVTAVINQGVATSAELPTVLTDDPALGGAADPTETIIRAAPNLVAEKSDALAVDADGDGVVSPGDTLEYTVTLINTGNTSATAVGFSDAIPAHTAVVAGSVTTSQGTVDAQDPVKVTVGEIPGGDATVTITFRVEIDDPVPAGVMAVVNQGVATSAEPLPVPTDDPDLGGDADPTETMIRAEPKLVVEKTDVLFTDADGDSVASPGDKLLYSITVTNTGNTSATAAALTDPVPENTTVVAGSVQASQGTVLGQNPVEVDLGEIPGGGGSATVTFRVLIDDPFPSIATAVANQATVASYELAEVPSDDPDTPAATDPTATEVFITSAIVLADATELEAAAATGELSFAVSLSGPSNREVRVDYATVDGTALAGLDYQAAAGTVILAPGETAVEIVVFGLDDLLDEPDETFILAFSDPQGATLPDPEAEGTILDDDPAPLAVIDDVIVTEGDSGAVQALFTVTLSAPSSFAIEIDYATADVTAAAGADYQAAPGTLQIPAGAISAAIPIDVLGDLVDEADESFRVLLTNPVQVVLADPEGVGTILDDDPPAEVSIDDVTVAEGDVGAVQALFTVSLSAPSSFDISVDYATTDGTATAGADYTAAAGTVVIPAGSTSSTVAVDVLGDLLDEPDEAFSVNLGGPVNATLADPQGLGTILDDDEPPALSIDDVTVTEGDTDATDAVFTVTLSAPSGFDVSVDYATVDGTATDGADYQAAAGTLTIAAGAAAGTVSVPVLGDLLDEPDETFRVVLTNPVQVTLADAEGLGTILDNDPPEITIDDVEVTEGDAGFVTEALFTVTLSSPAEAEVGVDYATTDETATAGIDYEATAGLLTIPTGANSATISVPVLGDGHLEDDETFTLELSNPVNARIVVGLGVGTILDDEPCPGPNLLSNPGAEEDLLCRELPGWTPVLGGGWQARYADPAPFAGLACFWAGEGDLAELRQDVDVAAYAAWISGGSQSFRFTGWVRTFDEVPGDTARIVVEYRDATNTVVLDAWDSGEISSPAAWLEVADERSTPVGTGWIRVRLLATRLGALPELDGYFDALSLVSLRRPVVTAGDVLLVEGDVGTVDAVFPLMLNCPVGGEIALTVETADGSALAGQDYQALAPTPVAFAGVTELAVPVPVFGDLTEEPDETFVLLLANAAEAALVDPEAEGTILDDDTPLFCPRSKGYWKNHLEAWPVEMLRLGCVDYDAEGLLGLLRYGGPDAATKLARQLTATKLNLAAGSDPVILPIVQEADAFLAAWPPGSKPRKDARKEANRLKDLLDDYNNADCDD